MIKTKLHPRHNIPSVEEMEYIEYLRSIPVTINFFSNSQSAIKIEPYTTIRDVKKIMMDVLGFPLHNSLYYSVYEICQRKNGTEERFIDDNEVVCDIFSIWHREHKKEKKKSKEGTNDNPILDFKFFFKILIYYPFDDDDEDTITMLYYQTWYDYISGKFNIDEDQIVALTSLQWLNDFGGDKEAVYRSLQKYIEKYVPVNKIDMNTTSQWCEKIMSMYNEVCSYTRTQAKINFLGLLKSVPTYQAQQFDAKFNLAKSGSNDENIPDDCVIGIKPEGIYIFDKERNEIHSFKYEAIMNWGISTDQFIICLSSDEAGIRKICFYTTQTKVIQNMLEIYCNIIAGKTWKEINELLKQDKGKFDQIETSRSRGASKYHKKSIKE